MKNFDECERIDLISPGEILLTEFLEPSGTSQNKLARDIDIPVSRVNDIIQGKRGITVDTAIRFAEYFKTTVNFWLNMQTNYDIERAERTGEYQEIASHVRPNPQFVKHVA